MCNKDKMGRPFGVFCMAPDLSSETEPMCFVRPTASCGAQPLQPSGCSIFLDGTPCISAGPCTNPDSRSSVFVEGSRMFQQYMVVLGGLCVALFVSSLSSGILCCGIEHVKSLVKNRSL